MINDINWNWFVKFEWKKSWEGLENSQNVNGVLRDFVRKVATGSRKFVLLSVVFNLESSRVSRTISQPFSSCHILHIYMYIYVYIDVYIDTFGTETLKGFIRIYTWRIRLFFVSIFFGVQIKGDDDGNYDITIFQTKKIRIIAAKILISKTMCDACF